MLSDLMISQRDGRYVIPVKSEYKKNIDGMVLDRSRTGGTLFIEPAAVKKLHEELAQLRIDGENEEYRILSELSDRLMYAHRAITIKHNSIVCELENSKGDIGVLVMNKKIKVNHKQLSLYLEAEELYPDDYDYDILFKSKEQRKQKKQIIKGKKDVIMME